MASAESVCNVALRRIGGSRITSLTDGSKNATVCNDIYETIRDDMLRNHPWNFAAVWIKLAQTATAPVAGFDYYYGMPSGWLRTILVSDDDAGRGRPDYREESDGDDIRIACSAAEVWIKFVKRITDLNKWSADAVEALAARLALDLAVPVANMNATLRSELKEEAKKALIRAKSTDAMSDTPEPRPRGTWVTSRYGWRRPGVVSGT